MKNKLTTISILSLIFILLLQVISFAALGDLNLAVKTEKNNYTVGEKITVTVDWQKDVQAAGFTLKYDASKLTFTSTTLGVNFYNADTAGEVLFNWASFDGSNLKNVSFVFTAKATGNTTISVEGANGFANEAMEEATGYTYQSKTIDIQEKGTGSPTILESLTITKTPTRNTYLEGEKFEKAGMEITANYDDGSKRVVTDYTYSPNGALKVSDTKIVISYTSNGVTKTVKQKITVLAKNDNSNTNGSGGGYGSDDPATTNKQENKDNTTASGKMPQTGIEKTVLLGIAFVALIGTIGFVGYRRLSDI